MPSATAALGVVDQVVPVERLRRGAGLERGQRLLPGRVGEHPVDEREHVVPGGAGGGPRRLGSVSPGSRIFSTSTYAPSVSVGQVVEVRRGVAQTVGVVDPQPVDEPLVEPAPDLRVRRVEDLAAPRRGSPASVLTAKNRR